MASPKRAAPYGGPKDSPKKTKAGGQGHTVNTYIDNHLSLNDEGEQMEHGLPLSDQHGLNTYKDHLESGKTLFNVVLLCKWHPPANGSIGHWRTRSDTPLVKKDLLKYLAPEELVRVKKAVEAVGSRQEKADYLDFEAWAATQV